MASSWLTLQCALALGTHSWLTLRCTLTLGTHSWLTGCRLGRLTLPAVSLTI